MTMTLTLPLTPTLTLTLTKELVAEIDNYSPIHPLMTVAQRVLNVWEACGGAALRFVRRRGLAFAVEYMHAEDQQTNFVDIGPVNKVLEWQPWPQPQPKPQPQP